MIQDISTDIELCNLPLENLGAKLQTICTRLPQEPSKIKGLDDNSNVDLTFFDHRGDLMASIAGSYRDADDTFPAVLTIYGNQKERQHGSSFNFNWHPFSSMGGLNKEEFNKQFGL